MSRNLLAHNKAHFDHFHPRIYGAAIGLVTWFALMAWVLFDRNSDVILPLMFVSVLFLVAVLLPWSLSLIWKKSQAPVERHPQPNSLREWLDGDFEVWGSSLQGTHAAIEALLPLIAVSFGLTAIGIVFDIVRAFAT